MYTVRNPLMTSKIKIIFILFFSIIFNFLSARDYDVLSFGVIPDGKTMNTLAIQKAIDKVSENGGGRIVFPKGIFLSGSIILKSGVELHFTEEASLIGSLDHNDYIRLNRWTGFIMADGAENIAISGAGEINGRGRAVALGLDSLFYIGQLDSTKYTFPEMRPSEPHRPQIIEFFRCKNIKISGVSIRNAAMWVQTYDRCSNLSIDNIKVISDAYWNNDGIDIVDCKNVRITNCYVNTADDGICLKSYHKGSYCDSIYIANCTIRTSASAVKLGTGSYGGFKNITIENIKIFDTYRSAIAIESVDGGFIENVLVNNIEATNTGNALFIRLSKRRVNRPTGSIKNILIKNMKVDICFERPDYAYDMRGPALPFFHNIFPASISGIPEHFVEDIKLENIEITYPGRGNKALAYLPLSRLDDVPEKIDKYPEFSMFGELPAWALYVRHVKGLSIKNLSLKIKDADYRPAFVFDDVHQLHAKEIKIEGDSKKDHFIFHKMSTPKISLSEGSYFLQQN